MLEGAALETFAVELKRLAIALAKKIVADGEGATHVMNIHVVGAANTAEARLIAKTIADSPLVKCAITGGDPNWGRIVSAAGYCGAIIVPALTTLTLCGTTIFKNGAPLPFNASELSQQMKSQVDVPLELCVGNGPGKASYYASDLTTDYVKFNSEYTT
jgi:glutamate N-acetyltransferase/amino-acid N-acetyltransferase